MYITRSRTNRLVSATHWNGTVWSDGQPNATNDAYIDADYSTVNGCFSCRDLYITASAVLTIPTDLYVKVLRNVIQTQTSKIIIKSEGNLMLLHKNPDVSTARIQTEATFKNHQRLDYEFISSPISGITLKQLSPLTLDNRFYIYDEATNAYLAVNPNSTLTTKGHGYFIRTPNNFSTDISDFNVIIENNDTGSITGGLETVLISRLNSGNTIVGNPYLTILDFKKFIKHNYSDILSFVQIYKKTNGAQGSNFTQHNTTCNNISLAPHFLRSFQGFFITKSGHDLSPLLFTPDMMLTSRDFTPPDRFYINLKQTGIFYPIGGFCYDVEKFPLDFEEVFYTTAALTIIDDGYKIISRKKTFNNSGIIPLRLLLELSASYSLSIRDISGSFEGLPNLFLTDAATGIKHDLKQSEYTFTSDAGEYLARFALSFL